MSVKAFYDAVPSTTKDLLVTVIGDLQGSSRAEKIQRLEDFLKVVRQDIDDINRRRKVAGQRLDNVTALLAEVNKTLERMPDLETELFRDALLFVEQELKREIADLRPERKLAKKFDVARRIEHLKMRQQLARRLQEVLGKGTPAEAVARNEEMVARRAESNPAIEQDVTAVLEGKKGNIAKWPAAPEGDIDPVMSKVEEDDDAG
jgi:hypothetical protein